MLRSQPLRRTPLKRTQRKRITQAFRDALCFRSGGWCEPRLSGCLGAATEACHQWQHSRPAEAYDLGLALKEGQEPIEEPIAFWNGWMLLDDEGFLWPA